MAPACASCGVPLDPDAAFCDSCGSPVAASSTVSEPRSATPAPAPALPSAFADGRYTVQRFLGEGGRKRVYLAHDAKLDRDVAFAVIKTEGLDEAGLARVHLRKKVERALPHEEVRQHRRLERRLVGRILELHLR